MNVSVFGLGYVGSVTAACLARAGHRVIGVDLNAEKVAMVNRGHSPIIEPGLGELLGQVVSQGRLSATTSAEDALRQSSIALICLGTPALPNGQQDTQAVERVAEDIAALCRNRTEPLTVVLRSTVLPGTTERLFGSLLAAGSSGCRGRIALAVNPEFMREGSSLDDFDHPPFVLVGTDDAGAGDALRELYAGVSAPFVQTSIRTAEMVKYACNAFHAVKVTFTNEIADVCEALGADAQEVMRVFRLDRKLNVSDAYLKPGFAFGGSCLPKDVRALVQAGRTRSIPVPLLDSIMPANENQVRRGIEAVLQTGRRRVGVVGLAFKPGTDDLRESPMVSLVEALIGKGRDVRILDPSVSMARLVGANRRYIETEIPHIATLLCAHLDELLDHAEVLVLGSASPDARRALAAVDGHRTIVDLTRGAVRAAAPPSAGRRSAPAPAAAPSEPASIHRPRPVGAGSGRSRNPVLRVLARYGSALLGCLALVMLAPGLPADDPAADAVAAQIVEGPASPEPPREQVVIDELPPAARIVSVPAGGDLQAALDRAQPGDRIVLSAGAVYRGPFRLRATQRAGWIVIAPADLARLPSEGERVHPDDAPAMPRLVSDEDAVIIADPGAHHYRLVGLEIAPADGTFLYQLVELGGEHQTDASALPHHIVLDRCYIHGDRWRGARRGIAMNSRHTAVVGSHLSEFKEVGADSQAIAGWNGPGPFRIANNYLEAAGENVMFGGADPAIPGLVPADIEVVGNHFSKPLRWRLEDPAFEGVAWSVKNLFELKNARRVRIAGNVFEYNWKHAQNGFAILFTPRNQDGGAPWSVVEDVTFEGNVVRHVGAGVNILGRDDIHTSEPTRRIAIRNNLFLDVGEPWGGGRLFQLLDGTADVVIEHNTAFHSGSTLFGGDRSPHQRFVFRNNVAVGGGKGIHGSGSEDGQAAVQRFFPGAAIRGNLLVGLQSHAVYPPGNAFPRSVEEAGELERKAGVVRLTLSERYAGAGTDGARPGADLDGLMDMAGRVVSAGGAERTAAAPPEVLEGGLAAAAAVGGRGAHAVVFWGALALLGYVYFGYPALTWARARLRPRPVRKAAIRPTVSVVIAAHNEAGRIDARLRNLLASDYPTDRLEILLGSDGSTDETADRGRAYEHAGVRVLEFREWRGKPAVLNDLVRRATGEIVVFADARQQFAPDAIRALVANFADPDVGAVSGELVLAADGSAAASQGAAFYWRYEKFIRANESRAGSAVGATGAIYAVRRELFQPIPEDTILDDVLIPMGVVRSGGRVLFEPAAKAYDRPPASGHEEHVRKVRTIAGTFQLLTREPWLLNPFADRLWLEVISHKALRLAIPLLQGALLAANLALADLPPYGWLLGGQLAFYGAALAGHACAAGRRRPIVFSVPRAMCLLTWATLVAFGRFLTDTQAVRWERVAPTTART